MATYSSQIFRCFYTGLVVYCFVLDAAKYVSGQSVLCPEECWCLGSLVDCSKRHLTSIPTDLPTWVTMLELQSNRIASIPDGTFDRLSQLEDLDLSSNKLRRLNSSIFDGLSNLQQLKLASNKLTSLPILGPSARNLTQLILHHNRITNISPAALRGLTSLRTLDLSYNRIGHLRTDTFPADNHLQFLLLENNRIGTLQQGCLNNLRSLEILKLNRNRIASLPRDLFTHLESLNLLELSRNELTTVDSLVFSGLESLEELSLSRNQLADLMDGAFYGLNAIQQLELDGNELTTISRRWLFGLKSLLHLTVAHNRINETEASGWEFCPNLEYLDLSHNRLTTLETEEESAGESGGAAGQGTNGGAPSSVGVPPWPPLLRELYINNNRITQVADGAFIQLNLLQVLDLSDNFIAWTVEDMTGAFEGLESLLRLGLANNNINSISRRAFNGLTNLQSLDFAGNAITTVENNAFEGMPQLNQLLVNSSSMVCDCQMSWFPAWIKENNLGEGVDGRCAHPEILQAMDIFSVEPEVFTCDDRLKPFIIREPETVTSLKNDNVSLICTAGSTSDVPVTLLWKKDKAIMEDANPIYFERLNPNGVNEYTSVLSLSHIREDDQGRYQCIISNEFGVTYSKKARVTVHIFPSFTVTPTHVSVRVGGIAELPCAATGHPTPKIAWQKDGGINFPAARQRRIKVKTELAEFYIDNVQLSDTGVYTCTALNAAGTISTNATLTVLEPPLFTRQMKDLTIEVGEPAVLECNVEGSPRPSIRWFKDDEPFQLSEGMHLTDFDRYLIIMNAASKDGGTYICEATNSLGVRTDSAKLVVTQKSGTIWNMTTTSIIIVVVICCILGTSLIWVVIIYHTRKRTRRYRVEESRHHVVPPEIPSSTLNGSSEGTIHQETSSGVSSAATDKYQDENASDCDSLDGPMGKLSTFRFANQVRMAAIFPSETKAIEPPDVAPCPRQHHHHHHSSIQDGSHQDGMERYCPSDSISEADRTTLERRGQLSSLPCCNVTGRSLDSAINKHMYPHHVGGGRVHPFRKGGSDGEEGEIEEEDEDEVFMDEATRDRLQRERLLTNSDEGLGSQTASPVNRHNYRRSNHPPPPCCHSYTSVSSPEGRCTSPSSFKIPHEHAQRGDAYSRMAMSSSSLPCNGRVPNVHLYENPTSSAQDRDLIDGHLCRSHNHVNSVNVNNSNTNHSPVADPIRQSHSIPTAISSTGNVSPGIGALLSPTTTTHQQQVQNGHLPSHHRPHHSNRHNEKSTHQNSRKSGRHPEKHHLKSKTSPKSGQSIPRTSYLPSSNSHPAHHVTSPTLSSLTEA